MAFKKEWENFIPDGGVNTIIAKWQNKQPERQQDCATPSSLTDCPRLIWLRQHGVPPTMVAGWGKKQRWALGRIIENYIAQQMKDEGVLLWHWKDDVAGESPRFEHGTGLDRVIGTPDLLIQLPQGVAVSDSKTSRSDSFGWVAIEPAEIWLDPYWLKYKRQVECYYMLLHWNKDWFKGAVQHDNRGAFAKDLALPEFCHLFSYALDDGIVRREITWKPTEADAREVVRLIRRWNAAYASLTMPECTCEADGNVKFCDYGIVEQGKKVASTCCADSLLSKVKEVLDV
jgi:hypothetical protein